MEKRELTLNIRETNEQARRRVYKSKQLQKKISLYKKLGLGAATVSLAAGIVGGPIISNMAKNIRNTNDTKAAIQMVADSEEYLAGIKSNPLMSQVVSIEDFDRLEELTNAIDMYSKLKNKPDKTFNEQEAYLEACNTIGNAKQLVTDNYNAIIKKKIAEAYGIKDPSDVNRIQVYCEEVFDGSEVSKVTEIKLPTGKELKSATSLFHSGSIDKKFVNEIQKSNELEKYHFSKDGKIPTETLDKIIENFADAQAFDANYKLVTEKDGEKIKMQEIQRSKSEVRDERCNANKKKEWASIKEELYPNEKTILVVDDEKPIIDILVYNLKKEGYNTLEATDGEMGINVALEARPDLILLDVMLPKVDGLTVCNRVKQVYNVPILMISARDEEVDKIVGLELGADDYITKPFSVRELMARVKANLRKNDDENNAKEKKKDTKIVVGDLELDLEKVEVKVKGEVKPLTPKEFELVKFLAMQPGVPVTREVLLEKVWNYEYYGDIRTVDVTVCRIREKLGDSTKNSKIIINKRGIGYYLASK